ncbi:HNH endonuclease [Campylobacter sp. US33a]|uniref:HNH endonuclease n=1 Tax=Campylobacter sp. US33a TaxID=2498120 RepID=UPI00106806E7|nr:HNH endonuclease [Campylobacter sp. US33a]TEY02319.1 HNH endonuclease [Campylobacter sp. US33a]
MVSVKDVSALHDTCVRADGIVQDIHEGSKTLKNTMQNVTKAKLTAEEMHSTALVADAITKVVTLKAEVATLTAGLPQTAGALAVAQIQLQTALENLTLMEQRLSLVCELNSEFMIFCEENVDKLDIYIEHFSSIVNLLNARINHAVDALEIYLFDANIRQDHIEFMRQKSQYFEYQKMLYTMNKTGIKDVEDAYIEKLNAKKNTFITSKNASELDVKISKYNMPEFEANFETKVAISDFNKERYVHDKMANMRLKEAITKNDSLKNKFSPRQLEQIENGITPDGYTWHHDGNPPPGRLQLVDTSLHNAVRHTGGYSLWCERE